MMMPNEQAGASLEESGWTHGGFFILRTPLLPFDELTALSTGLQAPEVPPGPLLEAALVHDREAVQQKLGDLARRREIREAMYTASPSLDTALDEWRADPASRRGRRVESSFVHYLYRMASRPTPFGLCAGISVGSIGTTGETCLQIPPRGDYQCRSRIDGACLTALTDALASHPSIRAEQTFFSNHSLYLAAGQLRYLETRSTPTHRSVDLVAVAPDRHLLAALERARGGASQAEVVSAICADDPSVSPAEAAEYVDDLITSQLLVSELSPPVTGPDPLLALLHELERHTGHPEGRRVANGLRHVSKLIGAPQVGLTELPAANRRAAEQEIAALCPSAMPGRILQVDLLKPTRTLNLPQGVASEIMRGVDVLRRIGGIEHDDPFATFRRDFQARYGEREVPLCEVLDAELGIGFASNTASPSTPSILRGLRLPEPGSPDAVSLTERDRLLLRWTMQAIFAGKQEIVLGEGDVQTLAHLAGSQHAPPPLPDALSAVATILATSEAGLHSGDYRVYLSHASGPSGANTIGRFCHGDDELTGKVRAYFRAEERLQPHAIFAEVVHLAHSRAGNIVFRPLLRNHEIPLLARSGAPLTHQIPASDLRVSVVDDRVLLRSHRLDREIIPRLASAHNFESRGNLTLYQFLGYLQRQGVAGRVSFSFGALSSAPFLPRVVYRTFVLAKAQWNLTDEQLKPLVGACPVQRFEAMRMLRGHLRIPRWVAIADGDRQLVIDTENTVCLDAAVPLLRGRRSVRLVEFPHESEGCVVRSPEGGFTHELVVPYVRTRPLSPPANRPPVVKPGRTRFPPGSEWVYAKIYTSHTDVDSILEHVVQPRVRDACESGVADGWFFVRYADPDWHVRVRIHGDPKRLFSQVAPALASQCADLLGSPAARRLQFDTYEREVHRYGGPVGVELAERLFHADSEAVLDIIAALGASTDPDVRWLAAVLGVDRLLEDLGMESQDKLTVVRAISQRLGRALGADHAWRLQMSARYRSERTRVEAALAQSQVEGLPEPGRSAVVRRSLALGPLVDALRRAEKAGSLTRPISQLAESYVHMHINRMLDSATTSQELVICEILSKVYRSRIARLAG